MPSLMPSVFTPSLMACLPAVVVVVGALGGCPAPNECTSSDDCSFSQVCTSNTCGPAPGTGSVGGGGVGGGGGGGGGGGDDGGGARVVTVNGPLVSFQAGNLSALAARAGQPAGSFLVGIYEPGETGRDEVRFFDPVRGILPERADQGSGINFLNEAFVGSGDFGGACNFDHASVQRGYRVDGGDEQWLGCKAAGLLQFRSASLDQLVEAPRGLGADLLVAFDDDPANTNILQRRMYAARGDAALYVEQRVEREPDVGARTYDTVNVAFGEIAGLFKIADEDAARDINDLVVVFDRAYPGNGDKPALVPIERLRSSQAWTLVPTLWRVLPLPDDTHAVRIADGSVLQPKTLELGEGEEAEVNLEVFLPTQRKVLFGRLEFQMLQVEAFSELSSGFDPLLFDRGGLVNAVPAADQRILLVDVPGGDNQVFYVLNNQQVGWRLPLRATRQELSRNSDVRFTNDFNEGDSAGRAVGLLSIAGDGDEAWVGMAVPGGVGQDQLIRLKFDQ